MVVGIDAGGTRSVCQLADADGRVRRDVRGPGANLQSEGESGVEAVIRDLVARVTVDGEPPAAVCVGMAGVARPEDVAVVRGVVERVMPQARALVVSDALVALEAGTPGGPALVLIAGTGSIAYGRDGQGRMARAGGWGYVLGDEGSGYWLGRNALRAVVRAADGRGRPTALTVPVLAHYGVTRPQDLVRAIAGSGARPSAIAQLAGIVGEAAVAGDAVAGQLIAAGAAELARAAESVVRRLGLRAAPLWLAGGTLLGVISLRDAVRAELARRLPDMAIAMLPDEPALGAVRLACDLVAGRLRLPTPID
jgi:glucosamine kinase